MIPKRMFFFWANDKMSWLRYMTLYSFRKFNPEWEMILFVSDQVTDKKVWTEMNKQDFFNFNGDDYSHKIAELDVKIVKWDINDNKIAKTNLKNVSSSHQSNFLKWSELYNEGGFFSDLDILYIRPMDNLYNLLIDGEYDGMLCQTQWMSIGFLASRKGNQLFKDIFNSALKTYKSNSYQSAGVVSLYKLLDCQVNDRPHALKIINSRYRNLKFYNLPFHVVYPFIGHIELSLSRILTPKYDKKLLDKMKDDTIGFHWYAGFPLSQDLNNKMNHKNYKEYINIITGLIEKFKVME